MKIKLIKESENILEDVQSAVWSALANSNLEEYGYKSYWGWDKGDANIEIAKINSDESGRQADIPVCYLKCVPYDKAYYTESDEFTRICEEIRTLKGQPYLDGIFKRSPKIGTPGLSKILDNIKKKEQIKQEQKDKEPQQLQMNFNESSDKTYVKTVKSPNGQFWNIYKDSLGNYVDENGQKLDPEEIKQYNLTESVDQEAFISIGTKVYWIGAGNEITTIGKIIDLPTADRMTIEWEDGEVNTYSINNPNIESEWTYDESLNESDIPNYDPYKQSQEVIDEINSKNFFLASNFDEVLDDYETNQDSDWYIDVIKAAQENIKNRKQHQESKDEEKNYKEAKRNLEKLRKAHSTNVDLIELYHNRIKDYESKHNLSEECEATQTSDIATTIDYPKFKKGKKLNKNKSIIEGESKVYACLDCCKDFEIENNKWPYGENNCPYCLSGDTSPYEDEPVETKPTKRFYVKVFDPEMCEYWDFDNFDNKADAIKVQTELKRRGESAIIEDFPESSRDPELTDEVNYYNDTYNK